MVTGAATVGAGVAGALVPSGVLPGGVVLDPAVPGGAPIRGVEGVLGDALVPVATPIQHVHRRPWIIPKLQKYQCREKRL